MKAIRKTLLIALLIMLIGLVGLAGCGTEPLADIPDDQEPQNSSGVALDSSVEPQDQNPREKVDLSLKPDESGRIMILMYHNIGEEEKEWVRTPENFIRDLTVLYEKGYRPISLRDYARGYIDTEQGFTPVVLTFDDGNQNNFRYLDNGEIDPASAVGLLLDFHESHPEFPLEATFFLNGPGVFQQKGMEEKKLRFLLDKGMDVGNHSLEHANLKQTDGLETQRQIGAQAQFLENLIGDESYQIDLLALPYGGRPKEESLIPYLSEGTFEGQSYKNIAVLNVGWNPAWSPYDGRFDPAGIPRIRASETKVDQVGLYNYLEYFDKHPEERFISDGQPGLITVPKVHQDRLRPIEDKEIYTY